MIVPTTSRHARILAEGLETPGAFLRLLSVDPVRNRYRFYTLTCERTLWSEWVIRCTWGRIQISWCATNAERS